MENKEITAYKGFNADLTCMNSFQYEIGQDYEIDDQPELCAHGFHACTMPLDVFFYYPPFSSRYASVSLSGVIIKNNKTAFAADSLAVASKIHIERELSLSDITTLAEKHIEKHCKSSHRHQCGETKRVVMDYVKVPYQIVTTEERGTIAFSDNDYCISQAKKDDCISIAAGLSSIASAIGNDAAAVCKNRNSIAKAYGNRNLAAALGVASVAEASGDRVAAVSTDAKSAAEANGYCSIAAATDRYSKASNTGRRAAAIALGPRGESITSGVNAIAISTGYRSMALVKQSNSIAIATGEGSVAAGALGCWLVLAERKEFKDIDSDIKCVRAFKVDGKRIKPNTFYVLHNGEPVEAKY